MIDTSGQTLTVFTASYYTHTHTHTRSIRPDMNGLWCPVHEAHEYTLASFWSTPCPLDAGQLLRAAKGNYGMKLPLFLILSISSFPPFLCPSIYLCVCPAVRLCLSVCLSVGLSRSFFGHLYSLSICVCVCESLPLCVRLISQWAVCHTLTLTFSRAPAQIFTL